MKTKLYYIDPNREGFDDSAIGLFDANGVLIEMIDIYHGEKLPISILRKLGFDLTRVLVSDLIIEEEVEDSGLTNEMPSHKELIKQLPIYLETIKKAAK